MFERKQIALSIGDRIRFTKNVKRRGQKFFNNELWNVIGIDEGRIIFDKGEMLRNGSACISIRESQSPVTQAKTVDQVIVSVPVRSFSQANEAQFYVSMSRGRCGMLIFTDSKVALREAVTRRSRRLSFWELVAKADKERASQSELERRRAKPQEKHQEMVYER